MADPYDSDSAVEQILSEAMDLHALEQISSINLSGVSSDTLLPTDLESRFRKLKSFPGPNPKSLTPSSSLPNSQFGELPIPTLIPSSPDLEESDLKPKSRKKIVESSSSEEESDVSPPRTPRQTMCFWCSPKPKKTSQRMKKKKSKDMGKVEDDTFVLDSILSELNSISLKEQKRSLRKAFKEQERISKEAEDVVNLARQLSSRIDDFVIHDYK
ncbi:hypothetical protein ACHQM5_007718 [Ranunculus cassubicifolius]